jgi:protein-disulfide isomerase
MKDFKKYFLAAIIIIIVLASIALRIKNGVSDNKQISSSMDSISSAQAQSYLAEQFPKIETGEYIIGSSDARLKIFVYEDYSSIYSAYLSDTLERIKEEFGKDIAIIVRPHVSRNSSLSSENALAIYCAGEQGKWLETRKYFFDQIKSREIGEPIAADYGENLGLDNAKFNFCLTNAQKSAKIEQLVASSENYGVLGAPTIFIGSEMILGARPYDDFVDSNSDKIEGLKTVVARKLSEL